MTRLNERAPNLRRRIPRQACLFARAEPDVSHTPARPALDDAQAAGVVEQVLQAGGEDQFEGHVAEVEGHGL